MPHARVRNTTRKRFVPFGWPFAIATLARGQLRAVPLASVEALEAEGFAPREVAEWTPRCAAGRLRIFSVRDAASGRRVAHFGLRCAVQSQWWVIDFHSFRPEVLRSALELLADVHCTYQAKTRGKPHAPLGEEQAVRQLRTTMDREDAERLIEDNGPGVVVWQSGPERVH